MLQADKYGIKNINERWFVRVRSEMPIDPGSNTMVAAIY
jgi:hypothetical protein